MSRGEQFQRVLYLYVEVTMVLTARKTQRNLKIMHFQSYLLPRRRTFSLLFPRKEILSAKPIVRRWRRLWISWNPREKLKKVQITITVTKMAKKKQVCMNDCFFLTGLESEGPIISTTAIAIIRWIGKCINNTHYCNVQHRLLRRSMLAALKWRNKRRWTIPLTVQDIHMMKVLPPIAFEIYVGITQIVEYYVSLLISCSSLYRCTVFIHSSERKKFLMVSRFRQSCCGYCYDFRNSITQERARILVHLNSNQKYLVRITTLLIIVVRTAKLSSLVNLSDSQTLFGISARIVACESLRFLQEALKTIKDDIALSIPKPAREKQLPEFFKGTVDIIQDMTNFIMKLAGIKFIGVRVLMPLM